MTCQVVPSKVNCILDADESKPTLSVLDPEEAFLGAALVSDRATVFGEIIEKNEPFQTAVIISTSAGYTGSFESLRGKKYCHPGYNHDERITKLVLEQLDWNVIRLSCDASKTIVEQKFEALSSTFASSCRPGKWSEDADLDALLKAKYSSLCELCGSNGCATRYTSPLNDSLSCLSDNGGDIALTDLKYTTAFFSNTTNAQNYQFLCPNGTVAPSTYPCIWSNQLRKVLLTSSESLNTMESYVRSKLPSYVNPGSTIGSSGAVERNLALLLGLQSIDTINLFAPSTLRNYVVARRDIPTVQQMTQCFYTLRWSVTNDLENSKCTWLQQASLNHGLQPVIDCVRSPDNDTVANLDNIRDGKADLAFADANFGYIARKKNLTNIAYPETDPRQLSKIVIVVKNDTTWYTRLSDLQGQRICLPEYGGKEWLAFIDLLRVNRIMPESCDYGKLFSDFVGQSCAPGANSKDLGIANTDSDKLCSNCLPVSITETAKYCNADGKNKYYDSFGALTCLTEGSGDYAVIALNDLPWPYINHFEEHQFRVISKNGSLAPYTGFKVDEKAPISIIVAGEVIVKNGTAKYNDTILYLRDVEVEFGQNIYKPFKVFDSFNYTRNLLFPDSTPGLIFAESSNSYSENFRRLLTNAETCTAISGSYKAVVPGLLTVVLLVTLLNQSV